jgi:hypothetical protein
MQGTGAQEEFQEEFDEDEDEEEEVGAELDDGNRISHIVTPRFFLPWHICISLSFPPLLSSIRFCLLPIYR